MPADLQSPRIRPAAVAGLFYPRDPVRLQTEVLELMGGAVSPPSKVLPKALIAAVAIDRTDKPRAYTTEVASRQTDRQLLDRFPT